MRRVANRRRNLERWLSEHSPLPVNKRTKKLEKSLFSQLKTNGSFGAKVARRLESDYDMGPGYLDTDPDEQNRQAITLENGGQPEFADLLTLTCETAEEYRLLIAYRFGGDKGRAALDATVEEIHNRLRSSARKRA